MENIWKPVLGFEAHYEISDDCRVRRIKPTASGVPNREIHIKVARGYCQVCLWVDGRPHWRLIHRLFWEAFVGPIAPGMQINHKNGVKADNRLENLEVVTPSQNSAHKFRVLKHKAPNNPSLGTKNGSSKLDDNKVRQIRSLYATGDFRQKDLAEKFGVTQRMICMITRREAWGHVI